ncbi:hypothetical protein CR513_13164, partial [Mucuna pruriens]
MGSCTIVESKKAFDKKIRPRWFKGDLVLREIVPNAKDSRSKWNPNYEGSYMVKCAFFGGALVLADSEEQELKHPVNADAATLESSIKEESKGLTPESSGWRITRNKEVRREIQLRENGKIWRLRNAGLESIFIRSKRVSAFAGTTSLPRVGHAESSLAGQLLTRSRLQTKTSDSKGINCVLSITQHERKHYQSPAEGIRPKIEEGNTSVLSTSSTNSDTTLGQNLRKLTPGSQVHRDDTRLSKSKRHPNKH